MSKIFEPYVRAFIRDLDINKFNENSQDLNQFLRSKIFKALFRVTTFITQIIYKVSGYKREILFERYLGINPISLDKVVPEILTSLFNEHGKAKGLTSAEIEKVFRRMFGRSDNKNF